MEYVIEMNNITKVFPGIVANDDITLQVKQGEIHALLGENGAGKSTLMNVLFGLYQPEQGEIKIKGKPVKITNPNIANDLGIGMVHQHFMLVHNFTVTENIILGNEPKKNGKIAVEEAAKEIKLLIDESVSRVKHGSVLVENSGATMQDIVRSVTRVTDIMGEIASASDEQSRGIEQVTQAVTQMDQVTQQNAALVVESASAAAALEEQAITLADAVAVFRLADDNFVAPETSSTVKETLDCQTA